jgi:hypothetical protein
LILPGNACNEAVLLSSATYFLSWLPSKLSYFSPFFAGAQPPGRIFLLEQACSLLLLFITKMPIPPTLSQNN